MGGICGSMRALKFKPFDTHFQMTFQKGPIYLHSQKTYRGLHSLYIYRIFYMQLNKQKVSCWFSIILSDVYFPLLNLYIYMYINFINWALDSLSSSVFIFFFSLVHKRFFILPFVCHVCLIKISFLFAVCLGIGKWFMIQCQLIWNATSIIYWFIYTLRSV